MQKALKFYRDGLGFKTDCKTTTGSVLLTLGTKFELYPSHFLYAPARNNDENNPPGGSGFGGIALAYNVNADSGIKLAKRPSGVIVKRVPRCVLGLIPCVFCRYGRILPEGGLGPDFKFDENGLSKFTLKRFYFSPYPPQKAKS